MPLLKVDQFGPGFQIKIQGRQGSLVNGNDINQDFLALTVTREIDSPAGAWALSLTSRRDKGGRTWAQRIRPMDYVEIRFARNGRGITKLPIVMRGFVDRVTEVVSMDQNGAPFRQTTITGRDMGKLLLIRQLYILPELGAEGLAAGALQQSLRDLGVFQDVWAKLTETQNANAYISPDDFLQRVKKLIYDNTAETTSTGQSTGGSGNLLVDNVPDLQFKTKDMDDLFISPMNIQSFTGPVWNLISNFHGKPICEFLLQDTEEGPELLWRWAPFKDKTGKVISPVKDAGPSLELSLTEIMQYSVSTSDAEVSTYYYVYPQQSQFTGNPFRLSAMTEAEVGHTITGKEGENPIIRVDLAKRYGFKPYEVQFPLMRDIPDIKPDQTIDLRTEWQRIGAMVAGWMDKAFSHSVNLESGTMVLRGNEQIKIGTYIKFKETREEFYVQGVRHDFSINPPRFTTEVTLTRGLWADPSPYPDDVGEAGIDAGLTNHVSPDGQGS